MFTRVRKRKCLVRLSAFAMLLYALAYLMLSELRPVNLIPDSAASSNATTAIYLSSYAATQSYQQQQQKQETSTRATAEDVRLIAEDKIHDGLSVAQSQHLLSTSSFLANASGQVDNPHPFQYVINNPDLCRDRDIYIIAYVHSDLQHYDRRRIIRQTWAKASNYELNDSSLVVIFVMGISSMPNNETQKALEAEAQEFGDIIQEDFLDTYRNLTYKAIAALKWVSQYCAHAQYVLKSDDDIFINMFNLLRHLNDYDKRRSGLETESGDGIQIPLQRDWKQADTNSSNDSSHVEPGVIICLLWFGMPVNRDGKWAVPKEVWPGDEFPPYCSGSAFLMTTDVAVALFHASFNVPFFWIDDLYLTGLIPLKLGTTVVQYAQFYDAYALFDRNMKEIITRSERKYDVVFGHFAWSSLTPALYIGMWNDVMGMNRNGQKNAVTAAVKRKRSGGIVLHVSGKGS